VRQNFANVINEVAYTKTRVVIKRRGQQFAALVPIEDLKKLELLSEKESVQMALSDVKRELHAFQQKGNELLTQIKTRLDRSKEKKEKLP